MKMKTLMENFEVANVENFRRTSAVADSYGAYLGYLGAAIVTNSTNFYGWTLNKIIISDIQMEIHLFNQ